MKLPIIACWSLSWTISVSAFRQGLSQGRKISCHHHEQRISASSIPLNEAQHATRLRMETPTAEDVNGNALSMSDDAEGNGTANSTNASTNTLIAITPISASVIPPPQAMTSSLASRPLPPNWLGERAYILAAAAIIGLATGTNIAIFKKAVNLVREALYGDGIALPPNSLGIASSIAGGDIAGGSGATIVMSENFPLALIPAVGGLVVGLLLKFGGDMPPGLRDTVKEVDLDSIRVSNATPPPDLLTCTKNIPPREERNDINRFSRKALAATFTLGTGNSLGPEGPSVEAGMSLSRIVMNIAPLSYMFGAMVDPRGSEEDRVARRLARDRLLLACGAAAGVSAGFNAPLSGVFFALEIVQSALGTVEFPVETATKPTSMGVWEEDENGRLVKLENVDEDEMQLKLSQVVEETTIPQMATVGGEALASQQINISAILLAAVVSALTIQLLLGNELALRLGTFDFKNPLLELPLYLLLGAMSGVVAAIFSGLAQFFKSTFDGEEGPEMVRDAFQSLPKYVKPLIGSLFCGLVGLYIPQVLFFGYETLNGLFYNANYPTSDLFLLLFAKLMTTAIGASCGLVGGTFAPSLFLGGVLGAGFHNVVSDSLHGLLFAYPELNSYPALQGISGLPAFSMVGAASVLAALFRAPLTASLLLFECTRNYDVILPLMASAGVASLTGDIVEKWFDEEQRENDPVSWGDLATRIDEDSDEICVPPNERNSLQN